MQFPPIGRVFRVIDESVEDNEGACSRRWACGAGYLRLPKKGVDLKVSYYIQFADHLLKAKGEEVFRRVVQEGVDAYINNWKRKEAAEEKAYELKKQAEKLEALRERMKQHKDIL